MHEALFEPQAAADQRLLLAIVIAMAVHAMVVLGVRLPVEAPVKSRYAAMEVMLVPLSAEAASATSMANTSDTLTTVAPREPPLLLAPAVARPPVKTATVAVPKAAPSTPVAPKIRPPTAPSLPAAERAKAAPPASPLPLLPSAAQLIERSMALAASGAGLIEDKTVSGQSLAERTLYINNTRDFTLVTYKDEVRRKVKDFGQMVEREVPSGRAVLDVRIGSDGALLGATISKSSGIAATDAKAIRIVELAAPFAPIPPELAKQFDVLRFDMLLNIEQDAGFSHGQ